MRFRNILSKVHVPQNLHFLLGHYQYDALPSASCIRLLELVPSADRSGVQYSLKPYELQDAPPFQALSYTWGDPLMPISRASTPVKKPSRSHLKTSNSKITMKNERFSKDAEPSGGSRRHSIICDGQVIKVTSNLRDALHMLANKITSQTPLTMPLPSRYYWIDALCVNQQNVLERNSQVAKMAEIFKTAKGVIVWLGKGDEFLIDALTVINRIAEIPEEDWPLTPYTSFFVPMSSQQRHHPNLSFQNWLGFIAFINRPWFKRAWVGRLYTHTFSWLTVIYQVIQEIALARSALVVCGSKTFPWENLSKTLSFIKVTKWYHHLRTEKLRHVVSLRKKPGIYRRLLQAKLGVGVGPLYLDATRLKMARSASGRLDALGRNARPPLRLLLDTHRFSASTDPRDKIYAFLGLADKRMSPFRTQPNALKPDYNMSVEKVYTETARVLLTASGSLSLLSHVQDHSQTRVPNLPSWVPDYSVALDPYPLRFRGAGILKACKIPWKMNVFGMESGELDVQGYRLDAIDQASLLPHESSDPAASWASIVKLALSLEPVYPNSASGKKAPSRIEVLWRTLTTDTYKQMYPAPAHTGSLFIDYILNLQIRYRLTPWSSTEEFQPHHSPLSDSIYPEWRTLLELEPPESPYCYKNYKTRLAIVVERMFNGTYSPIDLAQLQHEIDQSGGKKRRLFKTTLGYLGTGPRSLRRDDEVWILHGGGAPFVLRRLPHGNYRLLGETFVYGLMQGEVHGMELPRRSITIE
jgi:hypothetical protein